MEEKGATQNSKLRLLFVEDNPVDAELALMQLQKGGFEVTADIVQTADDFRSKLASGHYDIVLSDLGLPNWSGLDALEILKQTSLDIPFIMVTGTVGEETVAECLKLGATDYVLKDRPTRSAGRHSPGPEGKGAAGRTPARPRANTQTGGHRRVVR